MSKKLKLFLKKVLTNAFRCDIIIKHLTNGSLVKRLRHQPLTLKTWVRFPYGSPNKNTTRFGWYFYFLMRRNRRTLKIFDFQNWVRNIAPPLPCRKPCRAEQIPVTIKHLERGVFFYSGDPYERIAIVAGSGNNGGDGFALAWILEQNGYDCTVFRIGQRLSNDSAYYAEKAAAAGVPIADFVPGCLKGFDYVVDCLLGTGFSGAVRKNYRVAIEEINRSGANIVSVDINSGMNGDTGEGETVVKSNLTVTIGYVKIGLIAENAELLYLFETTCNSTSGKDKES